MKKIIVLYVFCAISIFYSMCQAIIMVVDHPNYCVFLFIAAITQIIAGFAGMNYFYNIYQKLKQKNDER